MASTYTGDVIIAGNSYMRYRGYFEANGYSINDSQYRIDYYARVEMTQAYEYGVGISVDGGKSATGVLTSNPGSSWVKVAEVSGNFIINRETYNKNHTIYCNAYGTNVGYYGGAGGSTRAQLTFSIPARPQYSVSYNANGGTGVPSKQTYFYGNDIRLSNTIPKKVGYEFLGWSTSNTATTASYQPNQVWSGKNAGHYTLYAVWKRIELTVTFNAVINGGTVNGLDALEKTYFYGSTFGEFPVATKTNYEFIGWNTEEDALGDYITSDTVITYNMTLYAIFRLQANCRIKSGGTYKTGMLYVKTGNKYVTGTVYVKENGVYKQSTI